MPVFTTPVFTMPVFTMPIFTMPVFTTPVITTPVFMVVFLANLNPSQFSSSNCSKDNLRGQVTQVFKALKKTQTAHPNQWSGIILSSSATGLLMVVRGLLPLAQISYASNLSDAKHRHTNQRRTCAVISTEITFHTFLGRPRRRPGTPAILAVLALFDSFVDFFRRVTF